jgi:hypothetical protein
MRTAVCRRALLWRSTTLDVSIPMALRSFIVRHITLVTLLWFHVSWIPLSENRTAAISFLVDVCLNIIGLFCECVRIHYLKSMWNLWKFTPTFWNCEAAVFRTFFGQFFEDHHSLHMASHFTLHCEDLFFQLWTFYTIVLLFLHSLHFSCKLHIIHQPTLGDQLYDGLHDCHLTLLRMRKHSSAAPLVA